ncbi:CBS domain-containing protein [Desulfitobacterium sp.]|uniref:CBS domain-containing protein n=1 Tax=Desulfitobacterium sp. TaxID=49981 RepID=UPI002B56566C|nr:CBS domain-containing protein [Desulfitobacterium sp.]HVJ48382.1 CBS domain-containing protein [Desulfitobacterium sp.]
MNLILAHRQMDFDALASMVAAQALYPDSILGIDGKPNLYVQDYIALAKDSLPFTKLKDVPWSKISKVVLVDTHDFSRAAGLREVEALKRFEQLEVEIYDHHPYSELLSPGMHIEQTGACTTLLVEQILLHKVLLSSFEATLLALGIYEDTGSLLFDSTTVRDVKAVAYLLEQGANLSVVSEYLRKPLTEEQKVLLQELLDQGQTELFEGVPVYIASAVSPDYVGGLALLAHRVGEMEGAETLFLAVEMENRVYLVGRSRGRGLPVNLIAQSFGGAGHAKAASATLKNMTVKEVLARLQQEIKQCVRSPRLVRDIMSFPVKTVTPETKLTEVEQILLRYGHTGVPVVEADKLVGIISRRDVEKGLKHGLEHAPVKGFMTKEVVTVDGTAGWEEVQRLMVQYDIGRIPVLEDNQMVGIVSRSDVLRLVHGGSVPTEANLTRDRSLAMRQDIEKLLENLPKETRDLLKAGQKVADTLGYSVFIIGGFVRDLLLLTPTQDLDFVVEGSGQVFAQALYQELNRGQLTLHEQFGTARLEFSDGTHLDVASTRWEYYDFPGALPQVEESRLRDDLFRRDFTINAMALAINSDHYGELVDYYGGLRDLKQGEIRFLHQFSFIEDPTRILRAIRFAERYRFQLSKETQEGVTTALKAGVLRKLSTERFTQEFFLLLREKHFPQMGESLVELGVLEAWFEERLPWNFAQVSENDDFSLEEKWLISVLTFNDHQIEQVLSLRLTKELRKETLKFKEIQAILYAEPTLTLSFLDQYLTGVSQDIRTALRLDPVLNGVVSNYEKLVAKLKLGVDGYELKRFGISEGPEIGRLLKEIRRAWLEQRIHTSAEEKEFMLQLVEQRRK